MTKRQRLVVIGAVAAGTSAAAKAKRTAPDLEVVLLERGSHISYGACGLPYWIAGVIPSADDLVARAPSQFRERGIDVRTRHEVIRVDSAEKSLLVADRTNMRDYTLAYDRLVIATGAQAFRPPLRGANLPGVFTLRTLADGLLLQEALRVHTPRNAVIVGGGYIGLEMAEALRALDLSVTVVEMAPQLMVSLDQDMSEIVLAEVERHGVRVLLNDALAGFEGTHRVERVITKNHELPADLVLLAVGVRPNVELASQARIGLGSSKAIAVDSNMRTDTDSVYAAGDCAEAVHQVTRKTVYIPLGSTANKQGRVAGANAAGMSCTFGGVVGTALAKVFDLEVARTGLTEREAAAERFAVHSQHITTEDRARYYPGRTRLDVKLIMDQTSRRLLGAQLVGAQGAAKRVDVLAAALYAGMTVDDLTHLDYSYAPPYASVWDATLRAANVAGRCR